MNLENPISIVLSSGDNISMDDFAENVKSILSALFREVRPQVSIKGHPKEIKAFSEVLRLEKDYMKLYAEKGKDTPDVYRAKFKLNQAINKFERTTNIIWPFY